MAAPLFGSGSPERYAAFRAASRCRRCRCYKSLGGSKLTQQNADAGKVPLEKQMAGCGICGCVNADGRSLDGYKGRPRFCCYRLSLKALKLAVHRADGNENGIRTKLPFATLFLNNQLVPVRLPDRAGRSAAALLQMGQAVS